MRVSAIFREAKQDVLTGTAHCLSFAFILILVTLCFGMADMIQIVFLVKAANAYQAAGASVSILSAPGQINGTACDSLGQLPGVKSSGAVREESKRITLTVLRAAPIPVFAVTAGFTEVLDVGSYGEGAGVYLSDQVHQMLGTNPLLRAETDEGPIDIAGTYVYPNDGRIAGYGYAALIPTIDKEPYDECWVDIWPQSEETQALMYTAVLAETSNAEAPIVMGQLNTTLGKKFDAEPRYNNRITRFAPAITGVVGLGIGYMYVRRRRLEIASNIHAGVRRIDQLFILNLEVMAWLLPALLTSQAILMLCGIAVGVPDIEGVLVVVNRNLYASGAGVVIGVCAAWLNTKEKHLFRYFKSR